MESEAEEAN